MNTFGKHKCLKANRKLIALTRLSRFPSLENRRSHLKPSWNHNSNIVPWYGHFMEDRQTIKFTGIMNVLLE